MRSGPPGPAVQSDAEWSGQVQIRAHGQPMDATVQVQDEHLEVRLDFAVTGVAPGQAVVLYAGSRVVGSATISATQA